jgi:undecaprenyl-diphosphatase
MNPILLTLGESIDKAFYGFDMWIFHFFGAIQNTFLTYVAKFFTTFGDEGFVIPIAIFSIVLCFFKKTRKFGFTLLFAIAVGTIVTNVVVKPMALRIRPYNTLQNVQEYWAWYTGAGALSESDYSFPSGHTTASTEIAVALFLCFRKDNKKKIAWIFPAIALCTAGSRVYLMVHYPTDVIGGLIVGIISAVIAYFLMKLVMIIFDKTKLGNIDAGKVFKKITEKTNGKAAPIAICVAVLAIFLVAFIPSLTEGGDDVVRCAYNEEYNCYNEARLTDDYPAIDGQRYCKIHWKQLSGETE